jgi:DNA-binding NtrC family response regulator
MSDAPLLVRILVGDSEPIRKVRALIAKIAPTMLSVFIQGPTGSGKECAARAIHQVSGLRGQCVAANVCAIPHSMFESELFGHIKGAFTGALSNKPGLLAAANGGTLFLDEIGLLAMEEQRKLLRALELREFTPIGETRARRSDFRLISATNQDVAADAREGRFREDLVYRLSAVALWMPPLIDRLEDIPALSRHLLDRQSAQTARKHLDDGAIAVLISYHWPGNVRELRNVVELAAVLAEGSIIGRDAVEAAFALGRARQAATNCPAEPSAQDEFIQRLRRALEASDGDTAQAAEALSVSRSTVYRWLQQCGMPTPKRKRSSLAASATPKLGA